MATPYAYLTLMPATLLLASVNSVNSNHIGIGSYIVCLAVNRKLITRGATFCCYQMCRLLVLAVVKLTSS